MNNGLDTENCYQYEGKDDVCNKDVCKSKVNISDYVDVQENNETALMYAVYQQPVSVAIEADQKVFQFYSSGVFDGDCGTDLDHAVLAVGWGKWMDKNIGKLRIRGGVIGEIMDIFILKRM